MTGNSIAMPWPGGEIRQPRTHRDHKRAIGDRKRAIRMARERGRAFRQARKQAAPSPEGWAFSRERGWQGRPSPDEIYEIGGGRRMRGGGPFGGPPFGGGPFGGGPFWGPGGGHRGRGRGRARRGDVRLALLRLLAEEPRNGYQLMQTIEERSDGRWRPSPGSVYPTLSQLEDEGLVRSTESEGARHFELTDAGREHLESRAEEPAPWDAGDEAFGPLADIAPLVIAIGKAAWQVASVGDETQRERAIETLTETRRTLYRILAEDPDQGDEQPEQTA